MRGRSLPLSRPRRIICDLMHFSAGVPTVPVQRRMALAPVVAARAESADRPPWTAVFTKAFALVAAEFPDLRRAYCKFPWPHLYEYPASVAQITIEREYAGEQAVFGVKVKDPARLPVTEIGAQLREATTVPVESSKSFRRTLRIAGWPRPLRRLMWWVALNVGRQRANYFGTFGVSVYSALGAESLHPLSPLTCTLNYGPISADGGVDVRVVYDHRVMDGATVARALARLEEVLNGTIRDELASPPLSAGVWATRVGVADRSRVGERIPAAENRRAAAG
ncbi:MAG: hypothetical protein JWO38_538 [Gemmataceae bacterium]|nr:hypothetical protein [Gemmataceae bacterium]